MGIFDPFGVWERGCANHGTFKSGCWACASVAENDHQARERKRASDRAAGERQWADIRAQQQRNSQVAKQNRRQRRSSVAGLAFDLGVSAVGAAVRKNAEKKQQLANLPASSAPPSWQPDPLDASRLRWWDGQAWSGQTQPRPPQQPSYPAGWYPDHQNPGVLRYYDGTQWTVHTHPANGTV